MVERNVHPGRIYAAHIIGALIILRQKTSQAIADILGVAYSSVRDWMSGFSYPTLEHARAIITSFDPEPAHAMARFFPEKQEEIPEPEQRAAQNIFELGLALAYITAEQRRQRLALQELRQEFFQLSVDIQAILQDINTRLAAPKRPQSIIDPLTPAAKGG